MQYVYEEYTLLEAVVERDIEAVQAIIDDNPTEEELNERDRSGRVNYIYILFYLSIVLSCIRFKFPSDNRAMIA